MRLRIMASSAAALALSGCIHIHRTAAIAPAEIADRIQFPEWGKNPFTVAGPQLKALQIAMDDFRPLGSGRFNGPDDLARCLQHVENYDVWLTRSPGVTFIHFTPKEDERCGLAPAAVDLGASYAIDDQGVILKRE